VLVTVVVAATILRRPSSSTASPIATVTEPAPVELPAVATPARPDDGVVPDGVTVFDDGYAAVTNLDPDLRAPLRRAATDAAVRRVTFVVDSGWRSAAYQERLLRAAIATYGSAEEAARWVATPTTSAHVSGDAVDLGRAAAAWLSTHGAAYGLCRTYRNEPWHYELRPDAVSEGCPRMYADASDDPRLRP
jgi:LAS superfamily LD-carboxypeptidase LdcB